MIRQRIAAHRRRLRKELHRASDEEHAAEDIAMSFSLGVFVTALPTLGVGFVLFVVIAFLVERISKLALLASAVVLNPVVKWGVYAMSFSLGVLLLGPVEGVTSEDVSLSAGPEIAIRLVVGNLILAVAFSIVGYFLALRIVNEYRRRDLEDTSLTGRIDL